jgi:hypothetical protein
VELQACTQTAECTELSECMTLCPPAAAICQSQCVAAYPGVVRTFYEAFECVGCGLTCAALCESTCDGGCSTEATSCNECINDTCAQTVCEAPYSACGQSSACSAFATCIDGCDHGDTTCQGLCASSYPAGVDLYNAVIQCTVCTKPACWDVCEVEGATCEGFSAS